MDSITSVLLRAGRIPVAARSRTAAVAFGAALRRRIHVAVAQHVRATARRSARDFGPRRTPCGKSDAFAGGQFSRHLANPLM
jgi:hypothetical protein